MAKTEEKQTKEKGSYLCTVCKREIDTKACPYCGDNATTMRLAPDGVDQPIHRAAFLTMTPNGLRPSETILDTDTMIAQKEAQAQYEEIANNLRQQTLMRTEIKKKELELERMKKEAELKAHEAAITSGQANPQPGMHPGNNFGQPQNLQMQMDPGYGYPFMGMNPQQAFMSQLMKLDKDKRKELFDQLAEADPQAVATLQSLLAPVMPVMQNPYGGMSGMNGMSGMPGMPGMGGMTPWMWQQMMMQQMQQQQQPQQMQADPTETALSMMNSMFEIMQKMNPPKGDDGLKEYFKELKEELKSLRQKESPLPPGAELKPVLDEMQSLRAQVASLNQKKGLADSVNEIKELVEGLESVGLVKKPGSEGKTVDDELRLKKFEFEQKTKEKEFELQREKIEADKNRAEMGKAFLGAMIQRSMMKNKEGVDVPASPAKRISVASVRQPVERVAKPPATPPEIIESYKADAGVVMETRHPVKREA